jgi:hypothetical protein
VRRFFVQLVSLVLAFYLDLFECGSDFCCEKEWFFDDARCIASQASEKNSSWVTVSGSSPIEPTPSSRG